MPPAATRRLYLKAGTPSAAGDSILIWVAISAAFSWERQKLRAVAPALHFGRCPGLRIAHKTRGCPVQAPLGRGCCSIHQVSSGQLAHHSRRLRICGVKMLSGTPHLLPSHTFVTNALANALLGK
jgi:hypothetical protein